LAFKRNTISKSEYKEKLDSSVGELAIGKNVGIRVPLAEKLELKAELFDIYG